MTVSDKKLQRMLKRKTEGKVATSQRALGREERKSRPLGSELKAMTQRQRLNKMVNSIFPANRDVAVVMDLSHHGWQRLFPKKVLLWLTISEKGMSKLLFFRSGLAVNGEINSTKCLPEVASFIKKYHKGEYAVICSDLVSAHYSKRSLEVMERLNINVVINNIPKSANPPNVHQLRGQNCLF